VQRWNDLPHCGIPIMSILVTVCLR